MKEDELEFNPWGAPCAGKCGQLIADTRLAWCGVTGWERYREQGGTNHVAVRRPTGEFMCEDCMRKLKDGLDPAQGELM